MAKKIKDEGQEARALTTMQVADELRTLADQIIEAGGEITEGQFLALKEWNAALETKAQNIALLFEQKAAEASFYKTVEDKAKARRKSIENTCDRLREYLAAAMATAGVKSIKADGLFSISLIDGRESVQIEDPGKLEIGRFAKIVESIQPDKDAIKAAIDAGETVAGAHVETGKPYLMIR